MTAERSITTHGFDLAELSRQFTIAVTFPQSRAGAYPGAAAIAAGASFYRELTIDGKAFQCAAFGDTSAELLRAQALVSTLRGYKGLLIYAGGKLQDWARMLKVLDCYADASACKDPRAHCVVHVAKSSITERGSGSFDLDITPDFMAEKPKRDGYLFPCRLLAFNFMFKFQPRHPSSEADQIQAHAVREGCNWCPNFRQEKT